MEVGLGAAKVGKITDGFHGFDWQLQMGTDWQEKVRIPNDFSPCA